ncbi:hypothetical protein TcasGA2_TC002402 [Tribolium castaneum]|uniref:Uncharacterized protein n=1 Tax=Tribolium castaneum TaxID=7070 RepID=D6WIU4_TRICA|nr:hypothetical protein TcasGA2_TC002402 [Tribolium castaneum]
MLFLELETINQRQKNSTTQAHSKTTKSAPSRTHRTKNCLSASKSNDPELTTCKAVIVSARFGRGDCCECTGRNDQVPSSSLSASAPPHRTMFAREEFADDEKKARWPIFWDAD